MISSDEFRIAGNAIGESLDADLHESMLDDPEAEAISDLMAIKQAMEDGMDLDRAVYLFAGDLARKRLIEEGIMTI